MTMFRTVSNRPKFTFSLFLVIAWLIPICDLSAQSYWDAIFELGYEPITQKTDPALACRRIEGIHRFRELISDHLTADPDLLIKMRDLESRITSLDVANIYDFLPYSDADGLWRAIGVRGRSDFNAYRLNVVDPNIENIISSNNKNAEDSLTFNIRVRLNREALSISYPEVGKFLEKWREIVKFKAHIFDKQDQLMGMVALDSINNLFSMQFRIRSDRFIPMHDKEFSNINNGFRKL